MTITSHLDQTDHLQTTLVVLPPGWEQTLATVQRRLAGGDAALRPACERLIRLADAALHAGPFSVVDDELLPPSGDHHDYTSLGPYWWPNPETADGLPYVRRDGERNPESASGDFAALQNMVAAVCPLMLAWRFGGNAAHAEHAARLLRTFFLDPTTRMNPNLNHGQRIPGVCEGRGIGIIDTHRLVPVVELVPLLRDAAAWTDADDAGLRRWFAQYLAWLEQSPLGQDERGQHNNHGTWHDVQAAAFAGFTGQPERARAVLEQVPQRRIVPHIEPDGRQPHELARTLSFTYSTFNLQALVALAELGGRLGVDLWNFADGEGRGIRAAVQFLAPYLARPTDWVYPQIKPAVPEKLASILRMASQAYDEPAFERALQAGDASRWRDESFVLFYPAPA